MLKWLSYIGHPFNLSIAQLSIDLGEHEESEEHEPNSRTSLFAAEHGPGD